MILISKTDITLEQLKQLLIKSEEIGIDKNTKNTTDESFNFLLDFAKNKIIYGVNTGFGPMAQYKINTNEQLQLQYNLIRSHAAGIGEALSPIFVKAAMIARLKSLALGYSGVPSELISLISELINKNITPFIPKHGGVGASGDLVQLAHLALNLIGEGNVFYENKLQPTNKVFKKLNIKPFKIKLRDGLALINGTSVMTGIGIVNIINAKKTLELSLLASSLINEIVQSFDDHFSLELNSVKKHEGQQEIAKDMRNILIDSKLIRKREEHFYEKTTKETVFKQKVQEYYSLRCLPQILGPILETINNAEKILIEEINSVNDNPIIDVKNKQVFHGGNFHGDYISFEMDKLKIAITKLSMLAERQINFLMNDKLNEILKPFVNLGKLGLTLGLQGTQFTATSTTAENQMLSNPMYIHSIPNNNDNQDIVSMGTNSALITSTVIDNTFQVLAVQFLAIIQAVDYLNIKDKLSTKTKNIYNELRLIVPSFTKDDIRHNDLQKIYNYLKEK
jgi:histidine ammonia-lyase